MHSIADKLSDDATFSIDVKSQKKAAANLN